MLLKIKKKNPQNWRKFERALRKSLIEPKLRKHVKRANTVAGLRMAAGVREHISEWDTPANAGLTASIKGDNSPLVDSAQMWQGVTSEPLKWNEVFVGLLRKDRDFNVAAIVHEGTQIKVSGRMALMFRYLFWASQTGSPSNLKGRARELWDRYQGPWPLLKEGSVVNIPPRRFIDRAFDDTKLHQAILLIWEKGIDQVLRSLL